jgi:hypothetical protein
MSIFKDTLKPYVASQLNARKAVVSTEGVRDPKFLMYTTGKNSWVRMTSFVDAEVPVNYNDLNNSELKYSGQQLAKKYILEGGTKYNIPGTDTFTHRSGLLSPGSVYGSNIDNTYSNKNNVVDRQYGLRPMPGIESAEIMSKSAYGSLREATIKFYAWDKHQLEELELLFMRTGYTVLLEWGWSQYLTHEIIDTQKTNVNETPTKIQITPFINKTINPFQPELTEDNVYDLIEGYTGVDGKHVPGLSEKFLGNYDAILGYIKNFSWHLLPNGGFECTTVLISRGEIISTLKLSNNTDNRLSSLISSSDGEPALTNFEKIFYNLQAAINQKEVYSPSGSFYKPADKQTNPSFITSQVTSKEASNYYKQVADILLSKNFDTFDGKPVKNAIKTPAGRIGCYLLADGDPTQGTGIEYIPLNTFITIIDTFFTLENETGQKLVKIVLPQGTPCLASQNSVSIDPTTCLIKNSKAKLITGNDKNNGATIDGFAPNLYTYDTTNDRTYIHNPADVEEFLMPDGNGDIGNILVSIDKIVRLYKSSNQGQDGVLMVDYLQHLLNDISFALGGINDFKLFVDKNKATIIDTKYLEVGKSGYSSSKYKFDLIGLKSICRDVKINSRIFESQSTMIAVSAQARANIGDIYSSTQNYLNKGLTDRLKGSTSKSDAEAEFDYVKGLFTTIKNLNYYINLKCLGDKDIANNNVYKIKVPQNNEIQSAGNMLKTFQLQIAGEDINYKALIPFELELELDGISGFTIGQIFTIDTSILPRDYTGKHVGFIITGISHSLHNNDWVTRLKTQICLLDQDIIKNTNPNKGFQTKLLDTLQNQKKIELQNSGIWDAYVDWLLYLVKQISSMYYYGDDSKLNGIISNRYIHESTNIDNSVYEFLVGKINSKAKPLDFKSYYTTVWYPTIIKSTIPQTAKNLIIPPTSFSNEGIRIPSYFNNQIITTPFTFNFDSTAYLGYDLTNGKLNYNLANPDSRAGVTFLGRQTTVNINGFNIPPLPISILNEGKLNLPTKSINVPVNIIAGGPNIAKNNTVNVIDYVSLYKTLHDWVQNFSIKEISPYASPAAMRKVLYSIEAKHTF